MRSLHYPIALADDFDMRTIEQRVREKAPAFAHLAGLALKAFLVTSIREGAPANLYAPFYVWERADSMYDFLAGPLFAGVIASFGRPAAFDRPVLEFGVADARISPTVATIETSAIDAGQPVAETWRAESTLHHRSLDRAGLFAAATVLDTAHWSISRFALWRERADALHLSPQAQRLTVLAVVGNAVAAAGRPRVAA